MTIRRSPAHRDRRRGHPLGPQRRRCARRHRRTAGRQEFATDAGGDRRLLAWLQSFGIVMRVGVEGTGSYGVGLARALRAADIAVVEVDRPNRLVRRRQGKSDPLDAVEAARAALSGRAAGKAKTRDGNVEAIRALTVAQRSGRATRTKTVNQLRHLGFCAPEPLGQRFQGLSAAALALEAAGLRPRADAGPVIFATKTAMRTLGRRVAVRSAAAGRPRGRRNASSIG